MFKKVSRLIAIFCILFITCGVLSACSSKDPLVGTWLEPTTGITLTFDDSGGVVMSLHETSYTFTYTEPSTGQLDIKVSDDGTIPDMTMSYQIDNEKDTLTVTVNGANTLFNRVKKK